jgi:hypothetical protein
LVHTNRSPCFPRPRGFAPSQSSTHTVLPRHEHELPWVFPRLRLSPGLSMSPQRPHWFPSSRVHRLGASGSPPRSGRCVSARGVFQSHPCGWTRDATRREPGFPWSWQPHPKVVPPSSPAEA